MNCTFRRGKDGGAANELYASGEGRGDGDWQRDFDCD
jgi:hypothetical protein